MTIYVVLQCISFVSSLALVCGTINVGQTYQLSNSITVETVECVSETTQATDFLARVPSDSVNLLGFGICFNERREHDSLRDCLRILLDLCLLTLQINELGIVSSST